MKVTLNWLKRYVAFDWSPEELTERLTMLGLEVEGMQKLGGEFAGVVVELVKQSLKIRDANGYLRSYNGPVLRKLYGKP